MEAAAAAVLNNKENGTGTRQRERNVYSEEQKSSGKS
jgi:hypothetical protein